jgi:hypothetical protein
VNPELVDEYAALSTRDLVELVGERLVPPTGTAKIELTFNDGGWVNSHYDEKGKPFPHGCTCGRHRWSPICPVHPASDPSTFGAAR